MGPRSWSYALGATACSLAALGLLGACSSTEVSGGATPPCPPPSDGRSTIDWVPFVVVDGQMYGTLYDDPERVVDAEQVGGVVATVSCRVADVGDPDFTPRDGDAAYLPAGTEVHQVQGRPTGEALTAYEDGTWWLFEPVDE